MGINFLKGEVKDPDRFENIRKEIKLRPTIFLGLGGLGSWAVALTRDAFAEVFEPLKKEGAHSPIPDCIRFLCFDSAVDDRPPQLTANEHWHQLKAEMSSDDFKRLHTEDFYRGWMPDIGTHEFQAGCGGQRGLGRVLFSRNMQMFDGAFRTEMNAARSVVRVENPSPQVVLLTSLSGGTGAGCLLDICFYLRQRYPDVEILTILALLSGHTTDDVRNRNARIGAYTALKELNAFFLTKHPDRWFERGVEYNFPAAELIKGRYERPMDFCFLLTESDANGKLRLPTQKHVSTFMARCAFFLTAHCVHTTDGDKSFASYMNDVRARSFAPVKGAMPAFQVPALGQLHLPLEAVADYFVCKYVEDFLVFMNGGNAFPDSETRTLTERLGLTLGYITAALAKDENGDSIASRDYEDMAKVLKDGKARYDKAYRTQLLACGDGMPDARVKSFRERMTARSTQIVQQAVTGLREVTARCLKDHRYRIMGASDMLTDVIALINEEIAECRRLEVDQLEPARRGICQTWKQIRPLLDDVTKREGIFDFDALKIGRAVDCFRSFVNEGEASALSEARTAQTAEIFGKIKAVLDDEVERLTALSKCLSGGQTHILNAKRGLERTLLRAEEGHGNDPLTICSFSPLTEKWRDAYIGRRSEELNNDNVLAILTRGEWTPMEWVKLARGEQPTARLAQDAYDRIDTDFFQDLRKATLEEIASIGNQSVSQMLSEVRHKLTRAMCGLGSMPGRLDVTPQTKWFRSVDKSGFQGKLEREDGVTDALSFEKNHATYMGVYYPIALAGCDPILRLYEPEYESWRAELEKLARGESKGMAEGIRGELLKFHSFPGSPDWPSPTRVIHETTTDVMLFARGFAISLLLDPDRMPAEVLSTGDDKAKTPTEILREALSFVDKKARAPKGKRFGLFRIGKSNYWLLPRFEFTTESAAPVPIRMGSRVTEAVGQIKADKDTAAILKDWSDWFEAEWTRFYRDNELAIAFGQVMSEAGVLSGQQVPGSGDRQIWDQAMSAMEEWKSILI